MINFKNFNLLNVKTVEDLENELKAFVGQSNYEWLESQHKKLVDETMGNLNNEKIWDSFKQIENLLNRDDLGDNWLNQYQSTQEGQNVKENGSIQELEAYIRRVEKDLQTDIKMLNLSIRSQETDSKSRFDKNEKDLKVLGERFEKLLKVLKDDDKKPVNKPKPPAEKKGFFGMIGDMFSLVFFLGFVFFAIIAVVTCSQM